MPNRLKLAATFVFLIALSSSGSYATGSILTQRKDQAEALANGAGFYDSHDGSFRFAVAPILMSGSMEDMTRAAETLPAIPKHKPKR